VKLFLLATHNAHKVAELRQILSELAPDYRLDSYSGPEPVEDGTSFTENALIKARAAYKHTGLPALADDSGLAVSALNGEPGVRSARYAGTGNDADNYRLLLKNMAGVLDRSASFVCVAALVDAELELVSEGRWPGTILPEAVGTAGFGYDPIFRPEGYPVSAAELAPWVKNTISHRARAFTSLATKMHSHY